MNTVTQTRDTTTPATAAATADATTKTRNEGTLLPPVDVIEDASGITLYVDMPGVAKDKLELRVEGEQLTLEGEMALTVPAGMEATTPKCAAALPPRLHAEQGTRRRQGQRRAEPGRAARAHPEGRACAAAARAGAG
ncbi:MAG: Hsp20/alpha crystallin family protein [Rubrivivax sp.]